MIASGHYPTDHGCGRKRAPLAAVTTSSGAVAQHENMARWHIPAGLVPMRQPVDVPPDEQAAEGESD